MRNAVLTGAAVLGAGLLAGGIVAGCSNKSQQVYNDAPRTDVQNSAPAEIISMPDGFSNLASKCDGPNRVYVVFHNDSAYGSVAVVPNDPRCDPSAQATISGP